MDSNCHNTISCLDKIYPENKMVPTFLAMKKKKKELIAIS